MLRWWARVLRQVGRNILTPTSVFYTGNRWAIFAEDSSAMPVNTRFNVLVVSR